MSSFLSVSFCAAKLVPSAVGLDRSSFNSAEPRCSLLYHTRPGRPLDFCCPALRSCIPFWGFLPPTTTSFWKTGSSLSTPGLWSLPSLYLFSLLFPPSGGRRTKGLRLRVGGALFPALSHSLKHRLIAPNSGHAPSLSVPGCMVWNSKSIITDYLFLHTCPESGRTPLLGVCLFPKP